MQHHEFGPSKASVVGLMSEWTKDGKLMKGTDKDLGELCA